MKRRAMWAVLMLAALGCERSDEDPCPGGGERVAAAGQEVCVYDARSSAIIENGFRCPPEREHRHDAQDADGRPIVICAEDEAFDPEAMNGPPAAEDPAAGRDAPPEDAPPVDDPPPADDRRGDPPDDPPPPDGPGPAQAGERCSPRAEGCGINAERCFVCDVGLHCVPVPEDPGFGVCTPPGDGGQGDPCDADALDACGDGLACLDPGEGGAPFCSDVCTYTNFDCTMGFGCPQPGGICTPADPNAELPGECRPGDGGCADGEDCHARVTRDTYEGFWCSAAGPRGAFERCTRPTDCGAGLACVIHAGWSGTRTPAAAVFDLVWTGAEPHPLAGRSPSLCMPLCGPGLPECAAGQACTRIGAPAPFAAQQTIPDSYFAFIGVCNPL